MVSVAAAAPAKCAARCLVGGQQAAAMAHPTWVSRWSLTDPPPGTLRITLSR